jgi:hypothetical protein
MKRLVPAETEGNKVLSYRGETTDGDEIEVTGIAMIEMLNRVEAGDTSSFEDAIDLLNPDKWQAFHDHHGNSTMQIIVLSEQAPKGWAGPASWGSGTDGTEMVTWLDLDGWYGCLQGQHQGNWFEGEDQGPYETREEIEKWLRSDYEENEED